MVSNSSLLRVAFADAINPPPDLGIAEWADQYRILPGTASSEPGQWRTSRFPFVREIMDELSPQSPRQEIVIMGGAQVAKSECVINAMLYTIDYMPTSMMYVLPTIDTVEKFSKVRLASSISAIPSINEKIVEKHQKFKDANANTILMKTFSGGYLVLAGANSAPALRQYPIERLMMDEVDGYVSDLDEEGDPVEIAKRRTSNYPRRKIAYISTPAIKETSRIEPMFEDGDQRYYYVPCPHCGHCFAIFWENIKWEGTDPDKASETAYLECPGCKGKIEERYKTQMLEHGYWKATFPGRRVASFHISSLYSPLGFYSWQMAVKSFLVAKKELNKEKLKVFVNTVLGETWSESGKSLEANWVASRKETYTAEVPNQCLILTAGCDVQEERIECEVMGWGVGEENWSIDYAVFIGDTEGDDVWRQLDTYLLRRWNHPSGMQLPIGAACIDSGHRAKKVYAFCRDRFHRRILPVKGKEGWGLGYIHRPLSLNEEGVWLHIAYVDEIKSKIYSQLKIERNPAQIVNPGYCHFPIKPVYSNEYFRGLVSETLLPVKKAGRTTLRWHVRKGVRNEPLDCRAYNIAALTILNPQLETIAAQGKPFLWADPNQSNQRVRIHSKGLT
jgi:phage terminase large subunit GpA-like protein